MSKICKLKFCFRSVEWRVSDDRNRIREAEKKREAEEKRMNAKKSKIATLS